MEERRYLSSVLVGRPKGRNHLEDPGIDGRAILKWLLYKWEWGACTILMWLRVGTDGELL
jgi:hypothetical protein